MTRTKSILLLGGYGNAGRAIATACAQTLDAQIIVAGPNAEKAATVARFLQNRFGHERISSIALDVCCEESLRDACSASDVVLVASSRPQELPRIAIIAVKSGADYLDLWYSPIVAEKMQRLEDIARSEERRVVTQAGLHPGLPGVLVRYLSLTLDRLIAAHVTSWTRTDWTQLQFSSATREELQEPFEQAVYCEGDWLQTREPIREVDFGAVAGRQPAHAIVLGELRELAKQSPHIHNLSFHLHADHARKVNAPFFTQMRSIAQGWRDGRRIERSVEVKAANGYALTATATVAVLRQLVEEPKRNAGLAVAALWVDPEQFMETLREQGVSIDTKEREIGK